MATAQRATTRSREEIIQDSIAYEAKRLENEKLLEANKIAMNEKLDLLCQDFLNKNPSLKPLVETFKLSYDDSFSIIFKKEFYSLDVNLSIRLQTNFNYNNKRFTCEPLLYPRTYQLDKFSKHELISSYYYLISVLVAQYQTIDTDSENLYQKVCDILNENARNINEIQKDLRQFYYDLGTEITVFNRNLATETVNKLKEGEIVSKNNVFGKIYSISRKYIEYQPIRIENNIQIFYRIVKKEKMEFGLEIIDAIPEIKY